MSWDYIQTCTLYSEICVILFYIKFLFWLHATIQPACWSLLQHTLLSHTFSTQWLNTSLCYCPAAECTQPTAIPRGHAHQKKPPWLGWWHHPCQGRLPRSAWLLPSLGCHQWQLSHSTRPTGAGGLPGAATALLKGNECKSPLTFHPHGKAGKDRERSYPSTQCPRLQPGELGPITCYDTLS